MGRSSAEISREKRGHELRSLKDEFLSDFAQGLTRADIDFPEPDSRGFGSLDEARGAFHRHAHSGLQQILAQAAVNDRSRREPGE